MNIFLPRRPVVSLPFLLPAFAQSHPFIARRCEATSRRTTKKLRIEPSPFLTTARGPPSKGVQDHIVFNPPSSAPSPYHTPAKFLPLNDSRRALLTQPRTEGIPFQQEGQKLPPPVRAPYIKKYHLNEAQIEEIRKLRGEDPFQWTRAVLAKKFECSQFFVGMVCEANSKRKEQSRTILENTQSKWGNRRRVAREDKSKRREAWGRDE